MKRAIWGSLLGTCLLIVPNLGQAQNISPGERTAFKKIEAKIQEIFHQLNLTDEQKKQLDANKKKFHEKLENIHRRIKDVKRQFKDEIMKPQLDMPKINQLHARVKALLNEMEDEKLSSILEVRAILTPEQFSKFINFMHQHRPEHEDKD